MESMTIAPWMSCSDFYLVVTQTTTENKAPQMESGAHRWPLWSVSWLSIPHWCGVIWSLPWSHEPWGTFHVAITWDARVTFEITVWRALGLTPARPPRMDRANPQKSEVEWVDFSLLVYKVQILLHFLTTNKSTPCDSPGRQLPVKLRRGSLRGNQTQKWSRCCSCWDLDSDWVLVQSREETFLLADWTAAASKRCDAQTCRSVKTMQWFILQ